MPGCFLTSDGEVEGPLEYVAKMMQEFPFLKKQRGERKCVPSEMPDRVETGTAFLEEFVSIFKIV